MVWKVTYVTSKYTSPTPLTFFAKDFKEASSLAGLAIELAVGIQDYDIVMLEKL